MLHKLDILVAHLELARYHRPYYEFYFYLLVLSAPFPMFLYLLLLHVLHLQVSGQD